MTDVTKKPPAHAVILDDLRRLYRDWDAMCNGREDERAMKKLDELSKHAEVLLMLLHRMHIPQAARDEVVQVLQLVQMALLPPDAADLIDDIVDTLNEDKKDIG